MNTTIPPMIAPLSRRLAALAYDGLLLIAVILVATSLTLPFTRGENPQLGHPWRTAYLLGVCFVFFGWFWTHGGQTLGMRAWRIQLQTDSGTPVSWSIAAKRFVISLPLWIYLIGVLLIQYTPVTQLIKTLTIVKTLPAPLWYGGALLWLIVDHWPQNWRDRLSGTRVIVLTPVMKQSTT